MRGESHLGMNIATGAVTAETCFLIMNTESPGWLQSCISSFSNFMLDSGDIPKILFVAAGIVLYLIGGLLPDIDTPYSMLGRIIHIPVEHRTWTHAIWWPMIFCIGGIWYRLLFWLGLGVLIHDLWDKPSASGLNMLYPFGKKRFAEKKRKRVFKLYHTSKGSEYIVVGVSWTIMVVYTLIVIQCVYHVLNISFG